MTIQFRNTLFVLAGTFAGFLSGLLSPFIFGMRGAILGAALSFGVLFLNPWRKGPETRVPSTRASVGLGIAVGLAAFAGIWLWQVILPVNFLKSDFDVQFFDPLRTLAICLIYPLAFFRFYREWQADRYRAFAWFAAAPLLGALVRSLGEYGFQAYPSMLIFGALPFALLWLLALQIADPAWLKRRWDRCAKPRSGETGPIR